MQKCGSSGSILSVASAGALFPMPTAPVYAAAKSALVHFTRSVAGGLFRQQGIRLMALCPEFVDTPMVGGMVWEFRTCRCGETTIGEDVSSHHEPAGMYLEHAKHSLHVILRFFSTHVVTGVERQNDWVQAPWCSAISHAVFAVTCCGSVAHS